jgi:hypothetical protein
LRIGLISSRLNWREQTVKTNLLARLRGPLGSSPSNIDQAVRN